KSTPYLSPRDAATNILTCNRTEHTYSPKRWLARNNARTCGTFPCWVVRRENWLPVPKREVYPRMASRWPSCAATSLIIRRFGWPIPTGAGRRWRSRRSEEHTSELQSRGHLVCRLLLEKKKKQI